MSPSHGFLWIIDRSFMDYPLLEPYYSLSLGCVYLKVVLHRHSLQSIASPQISATSSWPSVGHRWTGAPVSSWSPVAPIRPASITMASHAAFAPHRTRWRCMGCPILGLWKKEIRRLRLVEMCWIEHLCLLYRISNLMHGIYFRYPSSYVMWLYSGSVLLYSVFPLSSYLFHVLSFLFPLCIPFLFSLSSLPFLYLQK